MSEAIQTALLDWQIADGIEIPVSRQFGDVYFSRDNGLEETRHVFLNGNDLSTRLTYLQDHEYFCVGETGFGTGLNILALWQLWQQVRPDNHSHLHAISVEKFPLTRDDLIRALNAWPELQPLSQQLTEQYPLPIPGCHRLNFPEQRFSLDLWLGDADTVFPVIPVLKAVNAWFLDGFAPACNPDMWQDNILKHIVRLSAPGSTFASFSVAGVLKRGLRQHGIQVSSPRGFGHKREMLKAIWPVTAPENTLTVNTLDAGTSTDAVSAQQQSMVHAQRQIAIIGAGIAGLSCAWALAMRGHKVVLYDQTAPLAGASGNPLALLTPRLSPIEQSSVHLMTVAWQFALNHYMQFDAFRPIAVHQLALKKADELLGLAGEYPEGLLKAQQAGELDMTTAYASLYLTQAGTIRPHQLSDQMLNHPLIQFQQAHAGAITKMPDGRLTVSDTDQHSLGIFDHAIVCCARHSHAFFENYPILRPIRGQISWLNNQQSVLNTDQAYSYGGYCMQLDPAQLILGASFHPGREDDEVLIEDHVHNHDLIHKVFPQYAEQLSPVEQWQGRASIRAQSPDFFPLVGKLQPDSEIYTLAGLGSKGFLYAPLCSELLMALLLGEACPLPEKLFLQLDPLRFEKRRKSRRSLS
ncbi:FAD-dependent 5-carboxymethylaminomethyl-2-thiouridine(34) oxidoreductase MnmC [Acinetobacter sp. WZC-1]|uniref:FAD-dependent 5-carboxymethylaminomethyl-2-thiouridine(34) oxidoreductase MnmC n=1 Tax=Acinetobacter sp. WZC-1 TaxID=3459034 RepID=UPI00403E13D2